MATWLEDVLSAIDARGGTATLSQIYEEVAKVRSTMPRTFKKTIQRTIHTYSSDSESWNKRADLFYSVGGIRNGMWGLRSMLVDTPPAEDISEPDLSGGTLIPKKSKLNTYRILRDSLLCRELKHLHEDRCQICGIALVFAEGKTYSEAHHVIPLGAPHNGPDVSGNIIVVCPNHHAMLDYGAIRLSVNELRLHNKHELSNESIAYHNEKILK
jgi:hypothetical protein